MTAGDDLQALLDEQKAYYRARSGEYDDWFYRRGRYDHGLDLNARWAAEAAEVRAALHAIGPVEHALELACGTGIWTQELARLALRVTALDASAEMIAINRVKLENERVTYRQVDLFEWQPDMPADLVFMGFWLSHVPTERLVDHLATVRKALRPGGQLFMVDSRLEQTSTARNTPIDPANALVQARKLNDGQTFRVLKTYFEPDALSVALAKAGFQPRISTTDHYFIYGNAAIPKET